MADAPGFQAFIQSDRDGRAARFEATGFYVGHEKNTTKDFQCRIGTRPVDNRRCGWRDDPVEDRCLFANWFDIQFTSLVGTSACVNGYPITRVLKGRSFPRVDEFCHYSSGRFQIAGCPGWPELSFDISNGELRASVNIWERPHPIDDERALAGGSGLIVSAWDAEACPTQPGGGFPAGSYGSGIWDVVIGDFVETSHVTILAV